MHRNANAGLKAGLYFSHLDWSHPDYPSLMDANARKKPLEKLNKYSYPVSGRDNEPAWQRFKKFHRGQLGELSLRYKPDLLWFDGDWERDESAWRMKTLRDTLLRWNPNVILNARLKGYGDYETPEQAIPIVRPDKIWEFCMTMNDAWGYQPRDTNYKSVSYIIRTLTECMSMGGNLLLAIGPKPDGTFDERQTATLQEIGKWMNRNKEAIYSTIAGLPPGHFNGPTTYSKDKNTIYLYQLDIPREAVILKGIRNKIKEISIVGTGEKLNYKVTGGASWLNIPGIIEIKLPEKSMDEHMTVIAVKLEDPANIYHGSGGAIEAN